MQARTDRTDAPTAPTVRGTGPDDRPTEGAEMLSNPMQPAFLTLTAKTLALGLAGAMCAGPAYAAPAFNNGGARHWIAFDSQGRQLGDVQFLQKIVLIVNTATVANRFTIFYEPQHIAFCSGTLAPGGTAICGTQPNQRLSGGYFQVIAAQPVLMGGHSDVPVMRYAQQGTQAYGADPASGLLQNQLFVWQQGCPPRPGSGCPAGAVVSGTGGASGGLSPGRIENPRR